ncbi:sperm flagellar protein 2 [Bombus fervidus]|uniref:sperm flagellar protein 2 n=1 Tax=Bombus fervidus TaxID=203811 RepID=UPI003AB3A927
MEVEEEVERERQRKREGREEGEKEAAEVRAIADDPEMARVYVEWLKNRSKRAATAIALKSKMQKALLSELWERVAEKQERTFDEEMAKRVLDQSRYEKQIVTKLCEVREQKNIMAENQKVVEDITVEANEVEHRASYERAQELVSKRQKDIEFECRRMCELRRRLLMEKIRKIQEKHWQFCRDIVDDLASIALNVGDHRQVNDGFVPLVLLSEWKMLFLKSQPIFDEEVPYDGKHKQPSEQEFEKLLKSDTWTKIDKMNFLRDALFDDYLETNPPWNESLPELAEELQDLVKLGRAVLGHIVHRLLNHLHVHPVNRSQTLLQKFKNVTIVLGIGNPTVYELIRALLDRSDIRTVRMEDAINYCLERYKQEMSDVEYIDSNITAATADVIRKLESEKGQISCARMDRLGKDSKWTTSSPETITRKGLIGERKLSVSAKSEMEEESNTRDKQTQTPRNIPYDDLDPVLTDTAYIGKWAYEFLTLGEPITDDLATKILIEYLKSLVDAKGWVLLDYPNTYEQMSRLETAMTGSAPPPDPKLLDFDDITVEDIETVTPRIVFEDKSDPYSLNRQSRLVHDPGVELDAQPASRTFATLFVRVKQQPKYFEIGVPTYETLKEDSPSIDKFYASRKIARILYYSTFDLATLKKLARLMIGDPLQKKPSKELFGDALNMFERETKRGATLKEAVVRRLLTEEEYAQLESDMDDDAMEEEAKQDLVSDDFQMEFESRPARPGEPNWQWVDLSLPSALLENLTGLWESLEEIYVEDIKELLVLKSIHASGIVPYADFIRRNALEFVKRPDNKQDLLHRFHQAFNAIDEDARNDADVKCELHRRVADFQTELWEICDRRRREAEEERRRFVNDQWAVYEAVVLFNTYIGIVQAEIDRCVDTIRLLQDYYFGMMKRPLREIGVSKVVLNKIEIETNVRETDVDDGNEQRNFQEQPPFEPSNFVEKSPDRKERGRLKTKDRRSTITYAAAPPALERESLRTEIDDAFVDRQKAIDNTENISLFTRILENVRYVKSIVETLFAASNEAIRREQMAIPKNKDFSTDSSDSIIGKMASRGQDLILEWRYAITYEIERVREKLDSIVNVARLDVAFLLGTLQRTFHGIYDAIIDRYWREMKSVNDMANVFCFAIEEGRVLETELLLEGDRFVVRSNVYVMEVEAEKPKRVEEIASSSRFRIASLARLMEIFKRVAPSGMICERSLVYIFQDLASHGLEEGEPMLLPCSWYQLRLGEISKLLAKFSGSVEYVDWREFLVCAMDLPIPNCQEMLIARDRFRIQDPELREVVTVAQYGRTSLWFLECTDGCANVQQLRLDEFRKGLEDLHEEELYQLDTDVNFSMQASRPASQVDVSLLCCLSPEETLRRMLAKELLCRMYMTDRYSVNYTALLLAFCKDETPRDGFAKALALALGNRVCTDMHEGERYVEELLERKRLTREDRLPSSDRPLEVAKAILEYLMYQVQRRIDRDSDQELEETSTLKFFGEPILPESVATLESFAVDEHISAESMQKDFIVDHEVVIYWLTLDICLTVLAAALSWNVLHSELIGKCKSFPEKLASIYEELRDVDLNDEKDIVLAHRLLNHDFMIQFLSTAAKFTIKNMENMVQEILRERQDT